MNSRIQDVITSINEVKVQLNEAASPIDKVEVFDRLQLLYVVLELECELALDKMFHEKSKKTA